MRRVLISSLEFLNFNENSLGLLLRLKQKDRTENNTQISLRQENISPRPLQKRIDCSSPHEEIDDFVRTASSSVVFAASQREEGEKNLLEGGSSFSTAVDCML